MRIRRRLRDLLFPRRGVCRNDAPPDPGPLVVRLASGTWTLDEGRSSWGQEDEGVFGVNAWWVRDPTSPEGPGEINAVWTAQAPPTRKELARGIHRVRVRQVRAPSPLDLAAFEMRPNGARWLTGAFHLVVPHPFFRSWASVPDAHLARPAHAIIWASLEARRLAYAAPPEVVAPRRRRG